VIAALLDQGLDVHSLQELHSRKLTASF
jgi:hypothetical protein